MKDILTGRIHLKEIQKYKISKASNNEKNNLFLIINLIMVSMFLLFK